MSDDQQQSPAGETTDRLVQIIPGGGTKAMMWFPEKGKVRTHLHLVDVVCLGLIHRGGEGSMIASFGIVHRNLEPLDFNRHFLGVISPNASPTQRDHDDADALAQAYIQELRAAGLMPPESKLVLPRN